ncbi:MAG: DUF368 domain-containing protein [Clostridia bacterium]|nr:DUF368 domain-containing protein [Clostridia bacterium]
MKEEINLKFKDSKQWFKAVILGALIGLAVIFPGVSGATIAIIFGLYSSMLYSLGNILKEFKKCFLFLLPIGIGMVVGFVVGFFFVREIFNIQPFLVICLFAGLMIGAFPTVSAEIKGEKWTVGRVISIIIGVIIPIVVGVSSIFLQTSSSEPIVATPTLILLYFIMGFIVSVTQIIPGLSCSALLMAFGQFGAILASIHLEYLQQNPLVIVALLSLAVGFIVGIVVFSKLLNNLLEKRKVGAFTVIVGLSLGSIASMFLNSDIYAVYTSWTTPIEAVKSISIGILLLAVGYVLSYFLVRYQKQVDVKTNAENGEK